MKRIISFILVLLMAIGCFSLNIGAVNNDAQFLIGDWSTSDGIYLSFYDDETFYMEWGSYYLAEEGRWSTGSMSNDSFTIHMDGSSILTLMSLIYGVTMTDYHFEVLRCNDNNFYLVQVYDNYTAKTSPCKLAFTRDGASSNFSYTDNSPTEKPTAKPTEKPTSKPDVKHTIISDNGDNHNFSFYTNEEIEDLVYSKSAFEYNPRLSHFLACMARSAYTQDLVKNNYKTLGFDEDTLLQRNYEKGSPFAPFTIGKKILNDGTKIIMITIRGSGNLLDFSDNSTWTETNFNLGDGALVYSHGWHAGFMSSEEKVFEYLKAFLGGKIETKDTTYVITGHSLGAGVGNLLSIKLFKEKVPSSNVYNYNFACPNVAIGSEDISEWNYNGWHNNIINVGNWCDYVTHAPGVLFESTDLLGNWSKWKKYGVSYWFNNGLQFMPTAHDMGVYLDYIEKELDETHFSESEFAVQYVSVWCPVDVDIYDAQGNPVAGTVDGVANYYNYGIGEKAIVYSNGDRKTFHLLSDEDFTVKLHATDNGEMKFGIGKEDLTKGITISEKWFDDVQLKKGKEMISEVGGETETDSIRLYVVDEDGGIIAEIMQNGTEQAVDNNNQIISPNDNLAEESSSFPWWGYLIIAVVAAAIIGASVCVTIIIMNKKKAAERRRKADESDLYY